MLSTTSLKKQILSNNATGCALIWVALFSLVITANAAVTFTTSVGFGPLSTDPYLVAYDEDNNGSNDSLVTINATTQTPGGNPNNLYLATSPNFTENWTSADSDLYFNDDLAGGNSVTKTFTISKNASGFHFVFGGVSVGGTPNIIIPSGKGYRLIVIASGVDSLTSLGISNLDVDGTDGPSMTISGSGNLAATDYGFIDFVPNDVNNFTLFATAKFDYGGLPGLPPESPGLGLGFGTIDSVPEPSSIILIFLSSFMLIFRKRR